MAHVASPEDWFDQLLHRLVSSDIDAGERDFELLEARGQFTTLVYRGEITGALYQDWYRRTEPEGKRRYSITSLASFCFLSAAAGIMGNVAYDAMKVLVRRLLSRRVKLFEDTISPAKYEELRAQIHAGNPATVTVDETVALLVKRRYWILVNTGEPKSTDHGAAT